MLDEFIREIQTLLPKAQISRYQDRLEVTGFPLPKITVRPNLKFQRTNVPLQRVYVDIEGHEFGAASVYLAIRGVLATIRKLSPRMSLLSDDLGISREDLVGMRINRR